MALGGLAELEEVLGAMRRKVQVMTESQGLASGLAASSALESIEAELGVTELAALRSITTPRTLQVSGAARAAGAQADVPGRWGVLRGGLCVRPLSCTLVPANGNCRTSSRMQEAQGSRCACACWCVAAAEHPDSPLASVASTPRQHLHQHQHHAGGGPSTAPATPRAAAASARQTPRGGAPSTGVGEVSGATATLPTSSRPGPDGTFADQVSRRRTCFPRLLAACAVLAATSRRGR